MSVDSTEVPNVLVVEDEMLLRMRAVDIVEDAGFRSVEAVNADEALSILESRSDISLLFTDIQMPGSMDGLKLAHAVHDRWPSIKIILVSGQVKPSDAERPADSRFFGKPLAVEQMIAELQAMVGAGALKIVPSPAMSSADETFRITTSIGSSPRSAQEVVLLAENDSLRLLLEQAGIDAKTLLAQAGIDAREREAADKLQKLILGELHHRIKNTLATVSAIASQSFRAASSIEHGQKAMEGRLTALGRAHDLLMQVSWANASLTHTLSGATAPMTAGGQTIPFQRAGYQNYLWRRYRACNDVERTLHQHHEIWCTLDPRRPRRNRMDDRRSEAETSPCLDRKRWSRGRASNTSKLRHPHDGVSRPATEWPGAAGL